MSNVLLVGYGVSGVSLFNFLKSKGNNIFVYDDYKGDEIPNKITNINWNNIDYVVKSPSIHIMPHNIHPIIQEAMENGKEIYSTFDIFRMYNPNAKIIGITGTNGKSTTTSLIYEILKNAGFSVQIGGNIGIPYSDLKQSEYYVFEMSSYEISSSKYLDFIIGAVLNIEPDHLDWHGSFENYIESKQTLLDKSKLKIISYEDKYSLNKYTKNISLKQNNDYNNYIENSVLKQNNNSNNKYIEKNQSILDQVITISINNEKRAFYYIKEKLLMSNNNIILDLSNVKYLVGTHNYQNIMFAYAVCKYLNVDDSVIINTINNFKPLPHRINIVRKINDILFINDSKGTNPMSSARALDTFVGYKIYWLVGGRSKKVNPLQYIEKYLGSIQKIYLFGESVSEFSKIFKDIKEYCIFKTLEEALRQAYKDAIDDSGASVILLSPMCASFDQFQSFEHRGNVFVELVKLL